MKHYNTNRKMKLLFRSVQRFGLWNGLPVFIKLITEHTSAITLPRIKHPLALRPGSSDTPTFHQVFLNNEYNIEFNRQPNVIIDAGANIGLFAIKMKNRFPDASIVCIEPDPENFQMLTKNLSNYADVSFENCGVWHKDTKLKVYDKYGAGKWGMVVEENQHEGNINAISIGSLLKKYNLQYVDVLKVDIETSEKQVFSENFEEWLPKVKTIIIELHDWMEPGCSKPFFEAINKSFHNYSYSHSGENVIITNEDLN